jgi:hypothetical protein
MIASYRPKLGKIGLSEASDIFNKMSAERFVDILDFIEYEFKIELALDFGPKSLKRADVKHALYFVEYLKNIKKEKYDTFHYFTKDDLKNIFEEILYKKGEDFSLSDFEGAISFLTKSYCKDLLLKGIVFGCDEGYRLNPYAFCVLNDFLSDQKEFVQYLYRKTSNYLLLCEVE